MVRAIALIEVSDTAFDAFSRLCTGDLSASSPSKLSYAIIPIGIVARLVKSFDAFKPGMV